MWRRRDARRDAIEHTAFIEQLGRTVRGEFDVPTGALHEMATRVDRHVRAQLEHQIASVVGVDTIELGPARRELLDEFVERNTQLITSLDERYIADVRGLIADGIEKGHSVSKMAELLKERAGVSSSRARVIARDQVATATRQMTQARHEEAGVTEYTWSTSSDERVRPACKKNHGKTFSWAHGDGGEHPGDRVMCRCQAIPDVEHVVSSLVELANGVDVPIILRAARFRTGVSSARIEEIMQGFMEPLPIDEEWARDGRIPTADDFEVFLATGTRRMRYGAYLLGEEGDHLVDVSLMPRTIFDSHILANFGDDPRDVFGVTDGDLIMIPADAPGWFSVVTHEISHAIDFVMHEKNKIPETYEDVLRAYQALLIREPERARQLRDRLAERAFHRLIEEEERAFRTQNEYRILQGLEPVYRSAPELRTAIRETYLDLFRAHIMGDFYGR